MKTTLPAHPHRMGSLTMLFVFVFACGAFGQSKLATTNDMAQSPGGDLNSALAELTRVAPATDADLSSSHAEGGKLHRITFWRRNSAHKAQMTTALRRNLQLAVPNLVRDTQASHGSISATFKLYNDLSVVCESLNSLVSTGSREGKAEFAPLSKDLSDMNRIREELSFHIQQRAALLESKNPDFVLAAGRPKKIIIDDNVPEKPTARKKSSPR
ncbi:MAG TPA: hypothetical protein VI685_24000 [Candidatus Angelobacter sp.]